MADKLIIGPINKGLRTDREPFVIDNDSFPQLINAYQWRGRVKRKRGTEFCTHLNRYFDSTNVSYTSTSTIALIGGIPPVSANLITGFSLQTNGSIKPGTVIITDTTSGEIFTDPAEDGTLTGDMGGTGTINYASGAFTLSVGVGHSVSAQFWYYPNLPVMGLEDFIISNSEFPNTIGFDTTYSYNILRTFPFNNYDVSFYKNPPVLAAWPNYVPKANETPVTWNGQDYQQFYTVNYQGALWATNGISIPFTSTNIGMQFKPILTVTVIAAGPPAQATLQITNHGLVVGDFVFVNEVVTTTGINFQTGYVIMVTDASNVVVEFPNAIIANNGTEGIAQYLTNRADTTIDCIRFYDGDPTNGSTTTPVLNGTKGWVNFAPPLSQDNFDIADLPPAQYYLAGARIIFPFKDRLLFIGPVVQTSTAGSQVYLPDTVIFSQNGTPYYTASFQGDAISPTDIIPVLVPINQTAFPSAWWEDQTGFGGYITLALDEAINTAANNEDVLILGLDTQQARFVYTGNDIIPFNFFLINSELGSGSTFSAINTDKGVITRGDRGYIITAQNEVRRIDVENPNFAFQSNLVNNGAQRFTAQRDFINEWVYFTYNSNQNSATLSRFPNTTLLYNYRDDSWAQFIETYTTYGLFRKLDSSFTWATVGQTFPTWGQWNQPWNASASTLLEEIVIAGNQQGIVVFRDQGTAESYSLLIQNISGTTVTSPNHNLNNNDFIIITDVLGTVAADVNGRVFKVLVIDANSFTLNSDYDPPSGTYLGEGKITRIYNPFIQSKQFPLAWEMARKTRIGPQRYLFSTTSRGQVSVYIYLSQAANNPYNAGPIFPDPNAENDGIVYSSVVYTCPESTNLGLTPANVNLNTPLASNQAQIWHRQNTSLIGDTVQFAITLSDEQLSDPDLYLQFAEIEFHAVIFDISPSMMLV